MNIDWSIWRVIISQIATLQEIEIHWSIDDLADANEALDIKQDAEQYSLKQAQRK